MIRGVNHTITFTPRGPVYSIAVITTHDGVCIATCQRTGKSASAPTAHGALAELRRLTEVDYRRHEGAA